MDTDQYQTLKNPSEGTYRERGSKFLSFAFPTTSGIDSLEKVKSVKQRHPKARHHCFAYRIGPGGDDFRTFDDGEPSGTAGRPMLTQIDSFEVTDVVVVVARYFGGKLLGAAGLANAYKACARDALQNAVIITQELQLHYKALFDYSCMGKLMQAISAQGATLTAKKLDESPFVEFSLPRSHDPRVIDHIIASTLDRYPDEISGRRHFDCISIAEIKS